MEFLEAYKRLEKRCGELLGDGGVSAYIDEMAGKPDGEARVRGWQEDLKKLKHYRWVRNRIAHEPGCTEKTLCETGDADWLEAFGERIRRRTDPLSRYGKGGRKSGGRSGAGSGRGRESARGRVRAVVGLVAALALAAVLVCAWLAARR